jgi:hypothetical protein
MCSRRSGEHQILGGGLTCASPSLRPKVWRREFARACPSRHVTPWSGRRSTRDRDVDAHDPGGLLARRLAGGCASRCPGEPSPAGRRSGNSECPRGRQAAGEGSGESGRTHVPSGRGRAGQQGAGGYLTWLDPTTGEWWQEINLEGRRQHVRLEVQPDSAMSLREKVNRASREPDWWRGGLKPEDPPLQRFSRLSAGVRRTALARARALRDELAGRRRGRPRTRRGRRPPSSPRTAALPGSADGNVSGSDPAALPSRPAARGSR